jgi:hypothetical protein
MMPTKKPDAAFHAVQVKKLEEARVLLAARGLLNARGELRRPTRSSADARRRLAEIEAELATERLDRQAAALKAERDRHTLQRELAQTRPPDDARHGWRPILMIRYPGNRRWPS